MARKPKMHRVGSDFSRRLEAEMTHAGLTQVMLASRLSLSPGTVSGWFTKGAVPQPRTAAALAGILGVDADWLLRGKGSRLGPYAQRFEEIRAQAPGHMPRPATLLREEPNLGLREARMIPLISWAQAGGAVNYETIPDDWQERIPSTAKDSKAFAITIQGDSMEPKYQEGDVAILLPQSAARNGDLVVANIKDEGVTMKILTLVGGDPRQLRLTSYNPAYPPMEFARERFHWIYPVHSVTKIIRR